VKQDLKSQTPADAVSAPAANTIMLVDDAGEILAALAEVLLGRSYRVLSYSRPQAAIAAIRSGIPVDLVITDLRMPGMDGLDLVAALKTIAPRVPVVMLTAQGDVDSYFKAFSLGVFDYVNKPIDQATLARVIKAAIAQKLTGQKKPTGAC